MRGESLNHRLSVGFYVLNTTSFIHMGESASITCCWPRSLELKVTVNCFASHGISGTDYNIYTIKTK